MYGSQGEGMGLRADGTMANISCVGRGNFWKHLIRATLKHKPEDKYEKIKPWESGR